MYHDKDNPDGYVIRNVADSWHSSVTGFGVSPSVDPLNGAITKDTEIKVDHYGERAADVEYTLSRKVNQSVNQGGGYKPTQSLIVNTDKDSTPGPDNVIAKEVRLLQNGYDGKGGSQFWLGANNDSKSNEYLTAQTTNRDQDSECVVETDTPIVNRRVGVCNDGIYSVGMRMTDTAGNTGKWVSSEVERDTVNPGRPNVSVFSSPSQIGIFERLGLEITGEGETTAKIEVKSSSGFSKSRYAYLGFSGKYQTSDLLGSELSCGAIKYTVTVRLVDRAGNVGEETSSTLITKPCPVCGGSGNGMFAHPLAGKGTLSSNYPIRAIQGNYNAPHAGLDFATTSGTAVIAAFDGVVKTADHSHANHSDMDEGWGNVVILVHEIEGIKHQTIYAHLNQSRVVSVGDTVKRGQVIGFSGNSGASTGAHLHFQVEKQGAPLHPKIAAGGIVRWNMAYPVDPKGCLESMESNLSSQQQDYYCPDTEKVDLRSGESGPEEDPEFYGEVFEIHEMPTSWINLPLYTSTWINIIKEDYGDYLAPAYNCFFSQVEAARILGCKMLKNSEYFINLINYMLEFLEGIISGYVSTATKFIREWIYQIQAFMSNPGKAIAGAIKSVVKAFHDLIMILTNPAYLLHLIGQFTNTFVEMGPLGRINLFGTIIGSLIATVQLELFSGMLVEAGVNVILGAFMKVASVPIKSIRIGDRFGDVFEITKFKFPYKLRVERVRGATGFGSVDLGGFIMMLEKSEVDEFAGLFPNAGQANLIKDTKRLFSSSNISWHDPNKIRFSQSFVTNSEGKYKKILDGMKEINGWPETMPPIEVVRMPDGQLTSVDNRRLVIAKQLGIKVKMLVHEYNELLENKELIRRFTKKKVKPKTWGDAVTIRVKFQDDYIGEEFGTYVEPKTPQV